MGDILVKSSPITVLSAQYQLPHGTGLKHSLVDRSRLRQWAYVSYQWLEVSGREPGVEEGMGLVNLFFGGT